MKSTKYSHVFFPIIIPGKISLVVFISGLAVLLQEGISSFAGVVFALFVFIFLIYPVSAFIYNYFPSPFENRRTLITSFTGGGTILFSPILWFRAFDWWPLSLPNWPFYRLLIYKDGLEIRFYFHCFFCPYDKMENPCDGDNIPDSNILIESELTDIPFSIWFSTLSGMHTVKSAIRMHRRPYLAREVNKTLQG